ncbi:(2Fe-2S) ferredoxin domain-containing protein [Phormidium sp. CCY1219]|uniref:(2Fe-2S) ferredoxin domain-containing protein n=1 Tax=Phormidium sp. CCY1219 TaxID=2886104 RepID=UPI002D1EA448|nr:(2Fe-2S) ferredoxin domain-containing protein [Phormidium sp. CCY1219]MEB3827175.1 (2Fe-2S) ferredoxin domain-containing protein [Phormidium sp. CCY1219]
MKKPTHHIFVCSSFRLTGEAKGVCEKKDSASLIQYLEEEICDRGLDALVSTTGCMNLCNNGPVMMVYPDNYWYKEVDEEAIDEILDALEEGQAAKDHLFVTA